MRTAGKVVAAIAGLFYLTFGIWAFGAPESFAANIANYGTYNEHLTHDLGAFQIGIGVGALAGVLIADALAAALAGVAAASVMHGVSHIVDEGTGGRASDPWTVSLAGLLVLLAFLVVARRKRASEGPGR